MKKSLLIAALALNTLPANAQTLQLSLNAGVTPFLVTDGFTSNAPKSPGYYGSARASLNTGKWQVGIGVDKFQTRQHTSDLYWDYKHINNFNSLQLFTNRKINLPKSYLYAGLHAGVYFGNNVSKPNRNGYDPDYSPWCGTGWGWDYRGPSKGILGGIQAGYSYHLTKNIGVNAEAMARYIDMRYDSMIGGNFLMAQLTFPVSLGVRYSL